LSHFCKRKEKRKEYYNFIFLDEIKIKGKRENPQKMFLLPVFAVPIAAVGLLLAPWLFYLTIVLLSGLFDGQAAHGPSSSSALPAGEQGGAGGLRTSRPLCTSPVFFFNVF
jgi:hypothetical protein